MHKVPKKKKKILLLGTTESVSIQNDSKTVQRYYTSKLLAVTFPQGTISLKKHPPSYQNDNRNPYTILKVLTAVLSFYS